MNSSLFNFCKFSPLRTPDIRKTKGNRNHHDTEPPSDAESTVSMVTKDIRAIANSVGAKMTNSQSKMLAESEDDQSMFVTQSFKKTKPTPMSDSSELESSSEESDLEDIKQNDKTKKRPTNTSAVSNHKKAVESDSDSSLLTSDTDSEDDKKVGKTKTEKKHLSKPTVQFKIEKNSPSKPNVGSPKPTNAGGIMKYFKTVSNKQQDKHDMSDSSLLTSDSETDIVDSKTKTASSNRNQNSPTKSKVKSDGETKTKQNEVVSASSGSDSDAAMSPVISSFLTSTSNSLSKPKSPVKALTYKDMSSDTSLSDSDDEVVQKSPTKKKLKQSSSSESEHGAAKKSSLKKTLTNITKPSVKINNNSLKESKPLKEVSKKSAPQSTQNKFNNDSNSDSSSSLESSSSDSDNFNNRVSQVKKTTTDITSPKSNKNNEKQKNFKVSTKKQKNNPETDSSQDSSSSESENENVLVSPFKKATTNITKPSVKSSNNKEKKNSSKLSSNRLEHNSHTDSDSSSSETDNENICVSPFKKTTTNMTDSSPDSSSSESEDEHVQKHSPKKYVQINKSTIKTETPDKITNKLEANSNLTQSPVKMDTNESDSESESESSSDSSSGSSSESETDVQHTAIKAKVNMKNNTSTSASFSPSTSIMPSPKKRTIVPADSDVSNDDDKDGMDTGAETQSFRYEVPSHFEEASVHNLVSKSKVKGKQLWLIRAPMNFDISVLNDQKIKLQGEQILCAGGESEKQYEVTSSKNTNQLSSYCSMVARHPKQPAVEIGGEVHGQIHIMDWVPISPPVEIVPPAVVKHRVPVNLQPTFKPFGSMSPERGPFPNDSNSHKSKSKKRKLEKEKDKSQKKKRKTEEKMDVKNVASPTKHVKFNLDPCFGDSAEEFETVNNKSSGKEKSHKEVKHKKSKKKKHKK